VLISHQGDAMHGVKFEEYGYQKLVQSVDFHGVIQKIKGGRFWRHMHG